MILNKENLRYIQPAVPVCMPDPAIFDLPEKVLQFGTGVLLRGLPDYFIDKANRQNLFNGRIVVVKSTRKGDTTAFEKQNALYTICVRGIHNQQKVEENIICSAISRVINAHDQWEDVLQIVASPELQMITSNTTENGIEYIEESIRTSHPVSFPAKLLSVLHHRYQVFEGNPSRGLIIVPTELISDNATLLKEIVFKLAAYNKLETSFLNWLSDSCIFCNTLVDRIVPGRPDLEMLEELESELGYQDELLICTEPYRLWAIEGDQRVKDKLSFERADEGLIIAADITLFKELKLRLLNGTHTLSCAIACLAGFQTVFEAMEDPGFAAFAQKLMHQDLAPAIPYPVPLEEALAFSEKVLERFRNPHIKHQWLSISTNYTMKLKTRTIPVLKTYIERFELVPEHIALGFAAYLHLMKNGYYKIDDEQSDYIQQLWTTYPQEDFVKKILSDTGLWESDLSALPEFTASVTRYFDQIGKEGIHNLLQQHTAHKRITVQ